jgi:hypothetical protein
VCVCVCVRACVHFYMINLSISVYCVCDCVCVCVCTCVCVYLCMYSLSLSLSLSLSQIHYCGGGTARICITLACSASMSSLTRERCQKLSKVRNSHICMYMRQKNTNVCKHTHTHTHTHFSDFVFAWIRAFCCANFNLKNTLNTFLFNH